MTLKYIYLPNLVVFTCFLTGPCLSHLLVSYLWLTILAALTPLEILIRATCHCDSCKISLCSLRWEIINISRSWGIRKEPRDSIGQHDGQWSQHESNLTLCSIIPLCKCSANVTIPSVCCKQFVAGTTCCSRSAHNHHSVSF